VSDVLARQAGSAMLWKALQLLGTKGIYLVRILVLAWLLTPEDFGLLAVAMLVIGVLVALTDFGMVAALVQGNQIDRRHYDVAWTIGVARALLVTVVVFLAAPAFASLLGEPRATDIMRVLALRPLLHATLSIRVAELTRDLRFRQLAMVSLPESIVNTIVSIALAGSFGVWALVAGALVGEVASILASYMVVPYRPRLSMDRVAIRPLAGFGRWIFLTGLVAMAGNTVLQAVISRQLGAAELGLYFLAARLAFLPYEVASDVVGAVAFPLYSRLQADVQQAARAFKAIFTGMAAVLLPTYALIIALAPALVQEVLGPQWEGTVPLIRLLALVGIVELFGDACVPLLKGLGQPQKVTVVEVAQSLLVIFLVWSLTGAYGLIGAALALLVAVSASQMISALFVYRILGRSLFWMKAPMSAIALASCAGAAAALGVTSLLSGLVGLLAGVALAAFLVVSLLWGLDRWFGLGLIDDVPKAFPQLRTLLRLSPSNG
jgi:lipopolysaccharide exporter